ncbi:hypothetical protein E2C01_021498 [Portunus trituberculatus]|uniref:Uncharacterized protein n=1 Tax=Portunus trituberculatus TaxID=210409 RepID=A0A5B7E4M0_PORTR|nr:hypothetical protein [Portunus trituberculatus]
MITVSVSETHLWVSDNLMHFIFLSGIMPSLFFNLPNTSS